MVGKLRDMRDQSRRVLILGSGPLATTLIEEIESAENRRYIVAGTVDDQMPERTRRIIGDGSVRSTRSPRSSIACIRRSSSSRWRIAATGSRCRCCSKRVCAALSSRMRSTSRNA
jgi:FlaA1/EpsC-like NDP-sugar epimerase